LPPPEFRAELVEGYYLGIVQESFGASLTGARLVRVQVLEVLSEGAARIQLGPKAPARLKEGEFLLLVRPKDSTTVQLKQIPDLVLLEEGAAPGEKSDAAQRAQLAKAANNLKQIGLALYNFHDTYGHFPPAVIMGPDDKPWHSWRVLLLPFLEEAELYNQYKFDEPWNGPNNKKLLEKMPAVYADPIHGENNKEFLTHYCAVTGEEAAFSADGAKFDGKDLNLGELDGPSVREFTDGTSNTILVGSVAPEAKIPWLKPDDVKLTEKFPGLGKKGGFAAPHKMAEGSAGLFLRADGSVIGLLDTVDEDSFRVIATKQGGEFIDWGAIPTVAVGGGPGQPGTAPVIYIETTEKGPRATLVMEAVEGMGVEPNQHRPQIAPQPAREAMKKPR
jgi:hypothetical protein